MGEIKSSVAITESIAGSMISNSSQLSLNISTGDGYTDVPVQVQCIDCSSKTKGAIDNFKSIIINEANALKDLGTKFESIDEKLAGEVSSGAAAVGGIE